MKLTLRNQVEKIYNKEITEENYIHARNIAEEVIKARKDSGEKTTETDLVRLVVVGLNMIDAGIAFQITNNDLEQIEGVK